MTRFQKSTRAAQGLLAYLDYNYKVTEEASFKASLSVSGPDPEGISLPVPDRSSFLVSFLTNDKSLYAQDISWERANSLMEAHGQRQ